MLSSCVDCSPMRHAVRLSRVAAVSVLLFAAVVAIGYLTGESGLYRPRADGPSTHPLSVAIIALLGWGMLRVSPVRRIDLRTQLLFALAGALALLRLFEMAFFAQEWAIVGTAFESFVVFLHDAVEHGTTGPNTMITGALIAFGQILRSRFPGAAMFAASLAPVLPLIAVFGHTFGFEHFHGEMSPITAALLLPLSLTGLLSFARRPLLRPLFAHTYYGRLARIELLAGVAFPWLIGAVLSHPETGGSTEPAIQAALMAMFAVCVVVAKTRTQAATERARQRTVRALEREAITDHLTRLTNRHGAMARFEALDKSRPVGVILADLDHFKQINDVWGHAAGDRVLVDTARLFKDRLSSRDIVARWGGEEFLIVLPGRDLEATAAIAEDLRAALASLRGPSGNRSEITASFGVSERFAQEIALEGAIYRADIALYTAKAMGRDKVVRDACAGCTSVATAAFRRDRILSDKGPMGCGCRGPISLPENASRASAPGPGSLN